MIREHFRSATRALSMILSTVLLGAVATSSAAAPEKKDYPITPVPFTKVKVTDAFWLPRIETNRAVTIPFLFRKNDETGRLDNFAIAGGLIKGKYKGERYNDTDVYKPIEGASYSLMVHPDPELDRALDAMIVKIAAAQEPDGYLFTARTCDPAHPQPGIGPERWVEETVSHELYNAGHLYEAAVAHYLATGKRSLLDVAIKNADLVASVFGPDKRHGFPGHQEIELALVKLYRVTGNEKYLALAKYFLDQRGHDVTLTQYPPRSRFAIYNQPEQIQAHKPVLEQDEAVGHAVRLTYMASGMADIAAITGDAAYLAAVERLWGNVVGKKMYLTAGVGSRHDRERFGENYELPNLTGYLETCASIGMAFWNQRMFLLTGDARYVDVMERAMYNGILSGVSLDGRSFFYANPLESDGKFPFNQDQLGRAPFFGTACCPGNISRFLPSMPGYVYAAKGDALYINLFVQSEAEVEAAGRKITVKQETRYPWDGAVRIVIEPEKKTALSVMVRIPAWARGEVAPGGLYRFADTAAEKPALEVNGKAVAVVLDKGFARIRREWKKGDVIALRLPMPVRRVVADEAVKDDAGKVALERGPLVYCAEWPDNGGRARNLVLPDGRPLAAEFRPDLLNGVVVITGEALPLINGTTAEVIAKSRPFLAIPYYAWAHRGSGEMAVWLPCNGKSAR
ncbi:MAG: glycoside hydrolase family 127 protein [Candidatus Aminicenantales bacterium]